ncbi:MAG: terminase family protein [Actinomycetota bacterium]|nr:terminase family protein [Actinomycetota bacterium]
MADHTPARDDLRAFADLAGHPLEPWQAEALSVHEREQRETAIVGPRRSGKSRGAAILGLHWCFRNPGASVLIISSTADGAKRLLAQAASIARSSPVLSVSLEQMQAQRLTLSNGSTLRCVASSHAAVVGWTASLVIVDEAAIVEDGVTASARPIIASEPDGRFLQISSALSAGGAFYDAFTRGEQAAPHTASFRWSLGDAHWISPTDVESAKASMSDLLFRAHYFGEFVSAADSLLPRSLLEAVIVDYLPTPLAELRPRARLSGGWDWGQTTNRTVFTAVGRLVIPGQCVFGVATSQVWRPGHSNPAAVDEVVRSEGHFAWMTAEINGLGGPLTEMLGARFSERTPNAGGARPRSHVVALEPAHVLGQKSFRRRQHDADGFTTWIRPLHASSDSKAAMYSALRLLVEQRRLLIPRAAEQLISELLVLRVDLGPSGRERIAAQTGTDDAADSLGLALGPYKSRDGWRVRIADLADPRAGLPDVAPPVGLEAIPTVDGPDGLRVPVRPAWQSVAGTEVTPPAGFPIPQRPSREDAIPTMRRAPDTKRRAWPVTP